MEKTEDLIREGAALKFQIDKQTARLREINKLLAESADFPEGKNTATLVGAGFRIKVQLRENIKYIQANIEQFRQCLPETKFFELFKTVYEPTSKKALDGFISHADPEIAAGLKWCMEVKEGSPQVTYESLEEAKDAA